MVHTDSLEREFVITWQHCTAKVLEATSGLKGKAPRNF